jgi:hypothetical protein
MVYVKWNDFRKLNEYFSDSPMYGLDFPLYPETEMISEGIINEQKKFVFDGNWKTEREEYTPPYSTRRLFLDEWDYELVNE